jgi:hypothetical protein
LCVVAAPVFAVPSLSITNTGLDANGDWTWNVSVTPTGGSSLAVELGLRESFAGQQLISAVIATPGVWDTPNPGTQIFSWETPDGDGDYVGLQQNPATDEVFAAIGSAIQASATATQLLTIKTAGPTTARLSTTMQLLGKYGTGGVHGRIAEGLGTPPGTNYSNFSGSNTRTAVGGDTDLSGQTNLQDLITLSGNFNKPGTFNWTQGDFDGTTGGAAEVNLQDLITLSDTFNDPAAPAYTPLTINGVAGGSGSLGGAVVPEPMSAALAVLGLLGLCSVVRRKK